VRVSSTILFFQDPRTTIPSGWTTGTDRAGGVAHGPNTDRAGRVGKGFRPRLDAAWVAEVLCAQWAVGPNLQLGQFSYEQ
jgi:hypothetical protein